MSFWWMYDNHTFRFLGTNLEHAIAGAKACFKQDSHGSRSPGIRKGVKCPQTCTGTAVDVKPNF